MKEDELQLNLLSLSYSRYFSRAHAIFECWVELLIGGLIGFFGLILSYIQVFDVKPDPFKLKLSIIFLIYFAVLISSIALYFMYDSRIERKNIVDKIKKLKTT